MKKKLLSLLMATCMMAMVLTGCGEKEATGDDVKSSVEEADEEESDEEESEEAEESEEVVESTEEAEESEEVVESTEETEESEEVVESTEEAEESEEVVESTEDAEATKEEDAVATVDSDIAKMYEGYFEKDDILPENVKITASAAQRGITMDITMAHTADMDMMSFNLDTANMDMYIGKEKVYCRYELQGQEAWIWAPVTDDSEAEQLNTMVDDSLVDTENVTACEYRESIEEDGVVYDLLDISIDDGNTASTATYFVNRETQKIAKCVMEQDGETVVCLIEEIDSIEVPEEAENATEGTVEDVAGIMIGVIFAGAGMATE